MKLYAVFSRDRARFLLKDDEQDEAANVRLQAALDAEIRRRTRAGLSTLYGFKHDAGAPTMNENVATIAAEAQ